MPENSSNQLLKANTESQQSALTGWALLRSPFLNKGSAFSLEERDRFGLHGLLPSKVNTLDDQVERAYEQYRSCDNALSKNTFLTSLKGQNQVLYFRLIQEHLKEMFPIIYTPTEGEAISLYSRLFRRPEGCFLTIAEPDKIESSLEKSEVAPENVDIVVVSDGEQILGIGDQGVGAILISVAKLAIYTLCAGIHPERTLPVVLDVGTDNEELLNNDLYLGLHQPRARGEEYDQFVDRFVNAARKRFPNAYIHFEDFGLQNARRILDKYTKRIPCFNDDVQGTGAVTLAALYTAAHVGNYKLQDLRVVMFGSGSAGSGIADQIRDAIAVEGSVSKDEAASQIWCLDKQGLLLQSDKHLLPSQKPYARANHAWNSGRDLLSVIKAVKPHVLIGTSTKPKAFTKEIVQEMAKHVDRPIIFPLSNPTRLHEADPKDLVEWTNGAVLTATGSPFPPVEVNGKQREIAECNNSTCFPGIGLGLVLSRSKLLTTRMLVSAVKALAAQAPALKDPDAGLLPDVVNVRDISVQIAAAVIRQAVEEGLAQQSSIPFTDDNESLHSWIRAQMWKAEYKTLEKMAED